MHLPFIIVPPITSRLSLNVQYALRSCGTSFLFSCQPCVMYSLAVVCVCLVSLASCISCTDMHSGMSAVRCTTSVLTFIPGISLSLSS